MTRRAGASWVLAAGGTGGHVFPALALAAEAQQHGVAVRLIGDRRGPEGAWCRAAGVPFEGVSSGKLDRRRPSPLALLRAAQGTLEARRSLARTRPDLVIGFGGFASLPAVAAARSLGVRVALHETNAYPGLVTRLFARRAARVILTQAATAKHLPGARCEVVPMPVREVRPERSAARAALGLPEHALVALVMGGSQGSLYLNETLPRLLAPLQEGREDLWVVHATGAAWIDRVVAHPRTRLFPFVDAPTAMAAADFAITRAGFGTLAEAAFHGLPLLMVPLPSAAEDHQRHNAQALAADGAGLWAEQGDEASLRRGLQAMLDERQRSAAAAAIARRSPAGGARLLYEAVAALATQNDPRGGPA